MNPIAGVYDIGSLHSLENMETETVRGLVAMSQGAPVTLKEIVLPDPGSGDAVVWILTCGVCHTDLHHRDGGINDDSPFLLGHEAAGIVERIGDAVTDVSPGDFVVLNWRAVCGTCRAYRRGEPQYCFVTFNVSWPITLIDGTEFTPALGIDAFAEKTLVHSGQCTKVGPEMRPAAVGLLGCGVVAGFGAAINTGDARRGEGVVVIGCGGVGCATVAGAALAGAGRAIVVDRDKRKLRWARDLKATDVVDDRKQDPVTAIRALIEGFGADVVIDAVGLPETRGRALYARDLTGTAVLIGVPISDEKVPRIPLPNVFSHGGSLRSSWYGDCLPNRDFPVLVDLYRRGRLDLDAFVSEEIALDEVERAFDRMKQGGVLRSVMVL